MYSYIKQKKIRNNRKYPVNLTLTVFNAHSHLKFPFNTYIDTKAKSIFFLLRFFLCTVYNTVKHDNKYTYLDLIKLVEKHTILHPAK